MPSYTIAEGAWDQNSLQPFQNPEDAKTEAVKLANSITLAKGQAVAYNTSTRRVDAFAVGGSNGLNLLAGFSKFDVATDASGNVFKGTSITAAGSYLLPQESTAAIYVKGTFSLRDVTSAATVTAQVDTFTPATIEVGDIFTLTYTAPDGQTTAVSYTATATTAANVSAGVIAAWNAVPALARVATASGTVTVVLTAVNAGVPFSVASTTTDGGGANTQTFTRAATTAAAGRVAADLITGRPGAYLKPNGAITLP